MVPSARCTLCIEVVLAESLVLDQMATKMCYHKQAVISSVKAGSKTFPDAKSTDEAMHAVSKRLWVQLKTPSHLRKTCRGVLIAFHSVFIFVLLLGNPV